MADQENPWFDAVLVDRFLFRGIEGFPGKIIGLRRGAFAAARIVARVFHGRHRDDLEARPRSQIELEGGVVREWDHDPLSRLGQRHAQVFQHGVAPRSHHEAVGIDRFLLEIQEALEVIPHGVAERFSPVGGLVVYRIGGKGLSRPRELRQRRNQQVLEHLVFGNAQLEGTIGGGVFAVLLNGPGVRQVGRQEGHGPSGTGRAEGAVVVVGSGGGNHANGSGALIRAGIGGSECSSRQPFS
mmetsp:Transcript_89414/g.182343  ORF Transcript_89414/g.182343 Transcript_89414/m.182343 type:complete len:241 (+) Transcript_89414:1727-2449(+)